MTIWHWLSIALYITFVAGAWSLGNRIARPAPRWLVGIWAFVCAAIFVWFGATMSGNDEIAALGYAIGYMAPILLALTALVRLIWRVGAWVVLRFGRSS